MAVSTRQLKAMLRKNWLLKIRHPYVTFAEIFLPTAVMLIALRTQVDTRIHPAQPYIRKDMLMEVGKGDVSQPFDKILEFFLAKNEYLAFVPNSNETRTMINLLSLRFPLLKEHQLSSETLLDLEALIIIRAVTLILLDLVLQGSYY